MENVVSRNKKFVLTLAMCMAALFAIASTKLHALGLHAADCCGAGICVGQGQCYAGQGGTGSVCGGDGYWSVGCE